MDDQDLLKDALEMMGRLRKARDYWLGIKTDIQERGEQAQASASNLNAAITAIGALTMGDLSD